MNATTQAGQDRDEGNAAATAAFPRLLQILRALAGTGWAHYVERLHLRRTVFDSAHETAKTDLRDAKRFREMLEGLGPAFVKFGQLLSLRRDMLPESYIEELQKLQDDVAIFPGDQARAIIERELGKPVEELFAEFDETPLAAASIGQVHTAHLMDGSSVVVKVQRPGIEPIIHADINIMRFLARRLELHVPEARRFGPSDLVEEFARLISDELDYHIEARNGDRLRENFEGDPDVVVPRIYWDLTSRRVLTMERSLGHKLAQQPADLAHRQQVAEKLMQSFLKQVFEHGFFHGDPHPGNACTTSASWASCRRMIRKRSPSSSWLSVRRTLRGWWTLISRWVSLPRVSTARPSPAMPPRRSARITRLRAKAIRLARSCGSSHN